MCGCICVSVHAICIKFFFSQAGHISISLEPGDSVTEQHEQRESW